MTNGIDPISNPIGFLVAYFFMGVVFEGFIIAIKTGLITSIILFPFIFLGRRVLKYVKETYKWPSEIKNLFVTSAITTMIFWFLLRIWYVIFSDSGFIGTSIPMLIIGFIVSFIVVFIFVFVGDWLVNKFYEKYEMPLPLTLYVFNLILCLVFWIIVYLACVTSYWVRL